MSFQFRAVLRLFLVFPHFKEMFRRRKKMDTTPDCVDGVRFPIENLFTQAEKKKTGTYRNKTNTFFFA